MRHYEIDEIDPSHLINGATLYSFILPSQHGSIAVKNKKN